MRAVINCTSASHGLNSRCHSARNTVVQAEEQTTQQIKGQNVKEAQGVYEGSSKGRYRMSSSKENGESLGP